MTIQQKIKILHYSISAFFIITLCVSCKIEENDPSFPKDRQIAHRGYWTAGAPENSLQAVQYAIDANLYGAEIDVHETKDGIIVVNHDPIYEDMNIRLSTYQEIINKADTSIPLFEDFLIILRKYPHFKLIVEIKSVYNVSSVSKLVDQYELSNQIEFISFNKSYCEDILQLNSKYRVGYLSGDLSPQYLADKGYDIIDSSCDSYISNPQIIKEAYSLGLDVYTWTVNDATTMSMMYNMGVMIITTDYPIFH